LLFCGKCGSKMYHKYKKDGKTGKRYPIYECSSRSRGLGCKMPRVQARSAITDGGVQKLVRRLVRRQALPVTYGVDDILAKELQERLTKNPEIIAAAIQETIDANQSEESKIKLVIEEKAVKELERKFANYTEAIGEAESKEVRQSISKKLEDIGMQLATARTNTTMLSRELKASIDPVKAAAHVQAVFAGFADLPRNEQRVLLEKYVAKIIYHESKNQPVIKKGQSDYSSIEVKMKLPEEAFYFASDSQANTGGAL